MKIIDDFLNQITMYRLLFYYLILLVAAAALISIFGLIPFSPVSIILSALFLIAVCLLSNKVLAFIFRAPANIESPYITGLILSLIITPAVKPTDFIFLIVAAIVAMGGKYILFFERRHIFNPAAAAVATTAIIFGWYASWWVGTTYMLPFLLLGIFIVKKIKRFEMVVAFFAVVLIATFINNPVQQIIQVVKSTLLETPLLFFAFVMFTEPQTSPTKKITQIIYGVLVGILYSLRISVGPYFMTPEIALMCGNLFAWVMGMKSRLVLTLRSKIEIGDDIVHFMFKAPDKFSFAPGQYLEWTLPAQNADSRGNRRFFTIASSPTEDNVAIGVKFQNNGSSFKKTLDQVGGKNTIVAGQLSGDFTLPKEASKKLVFMAGGIGITPFRSMIKYLIDKAEKRDIVLFYANKIESEIAYRDVFDDAQKSIGLKIIYLLTDEKMVPKSWPGKVGHIDSAMIKKEVSDYADRTFYLSGPHGMVDAYKEVLKQLGVRSSNIVTDYFPGYV